MIFITYYGAPRSGTLQLSQNAALSGK